MVGCGERSKQGRVPTDRLPAAKASSKPAPPPGDLLANPVGRRAAEARPGADGVLDPEHVVDVARCDPRLDRLQGIERQSLDAAAAPLGFGDDTPGDVVSLTE